MTFVHQADVLTTLGPDLIARAPTGLSLGHAHPGAIPALGTDTEPGVAIAPCTTPAPTLLAAAPPDLTAGDAHVPSHDAFPPPSPGNVNARAVVPPPGDVIRPVDAAAEPRAGHSRAVDTAHNAGAGPSHAPGADGHAQGAATTSKFDLQVRNRLI